MHRLSEEYYCRAGVAHFISNTPQFPDFHKNSYWVGLNVVIHKDGRDFDFENKLNDFEI